jgi:hypothetical protein
MPGEEGDTFEEIAKAAPTALPAVVPHEPDPALVERLPELYPIEGLARLTERLSGNQTNTGATKWDRVLAATILELIARGVTLSKISKTPGMPNRNMWGSWVLAIPEMGRLYADARMIAAGALFDEAIDRARDNADDPQSEMKTGTVRLLVDTLKWAATKLNPRDYGEKAAGTPGLVVKIITNLDLDDASVAVGPELGDAEPVDMDEVEGVFVVRANVPVSTGPTLTEPVRGINAGRAVRSTRDQERYRKTPSPPSGERDKGGRSREERSATAIAAHERRKARRSGAVEG